MLDHIAVVNPLSGGTEPTRFRGHENSQKKSDVRVGKTYFQPIASQQKRWTMYVIGRTYLGNPAGLPFVHLEASRLGARGVLVCSATHACEPIAIANTSARIDFCWRTREAGMIPQAALAGLREKQ